MDDPFRGGSTASGDDSSEPLPARFHPGLVQQIERLVVCARGRLRHRRGFDDREVEADDQPRALGARGELAGHDFGRVADHELPALPAEGPAHARKQQAHVVVDFGGRADRRARVPDAVLLADGDGRCDALDLVHVRLLHPLEELPGVGGQRFDVAPLPFGVDRVEGERRLARAAHAGDDDQLAGGQRDVDVLEVVRAGTTNHDVARVRWSWRACRLPRLDGVGHARVQVLGGPADAGPLCVRSRAGLNLSS